MRNDEKPVDRHVVYDFEFDSISRLRCCRRDSLRKDEVNRRAIFEQESARRWGIRRRGGWRRSRRSRRKFRALSVVDPYTRECLALEVDTSMGSRRVTRVLEGIIAERGAPQAIRSDNVRIPDEADQDSGLIPITIPN